MKTRDTVILTKIIDSIDDRKYYYTVKVDKFTWHFYTLFDAENFVGKLGATYDYQEVVTDLI